MSFESFNFDQKINANIAACGYTTPTPIQLQAIPEVMNGRDLMGLAQTGTGKTAAFVLPMLQRLLKGPRRNVRALIVAPTRELAEQIHENIIELGRQTGLKSVSVYGGVGKGGQLQMFRKGIEIIVACPGRLLDHLDSGDLDLSGVEMLVLDEADMMFDMGFLPAIKRILKRLPAKRQNLLFSATMPGPIKVLADQLLHDPLTVKIGDEKPADTVTHIIYRIDQKAKGTLLRHLMGEIAMDSALVFTRTKYGARNLAASLHKAGHNAVALQGNMSQNKRREAMEGFKRGQYKVLVATDIAARGIDVSGISHVINYDVPDTVEAYTHRTGRTGRALRSGEAITFAGREDYLFVKQVEARLEGRLERREALGLPVGEAISDEADNTVRPAGPRRNGSSPGRNNRSAARPSRAPRTQGANTDRRGNSPRPPRVATPGQPQENNVQMGQDGGPIWRAEPGAKGVPGRASAPTGRGAKGAGRPDQANRGRRGRRSAPMGLDFTQQPRRGGSRNSA
jgi:ATP-dependent RNA helicase RhlE